MILDKERITKRYKITGVIGKSIYVFDRRTTKTSKLSIGQELSSFEFMSWNKDTLTAKLYNKKMKENLLIEMSINSIDLPVDMGADDKDSDTTASAPLSGSVMNTTITPSGAM